MESSTAFKTVSDQIKNMQAMDASILPASMVTSPKDILELMSYFQKENINASGDSKSEIEAQIATLKAIIRQKLQITALALGLNGDSVVIVPNTSVQTVIEFAEKSEKELVKDNVIKHDFTTTVPVIKQTTEELAHNLKVEHAKAVASLKDPLEYSGKISPKQSAIQFGEAYKENNAIYKSMEVFAGNTASLMFTNPMYWDKEMSAAKKHATIERLKAYLTMGGINPLDFNIINKTDNIDVRVYNWEVFTKNVKGEYLNRDGKVIVIPEDGSPIQQLIIETPVVDAETNLNTPTEETVAYKPTEFFPQFNRVNVDLTTLPEELRIPAAAADSTFKVDEIVSSLINAGLYETALNYAIDSLTDRRNAYKADPFTQEEIEKRFICYDLPLAKGLIVNEVENMGSFTMDQWVESLETAESVTTKEEIVANAEEAALKLTEEPVNGDPIETLENAITATKKVIRDVMISGSGSAMNIARTFAKKFRKFKYDIKVNDLVAEVRAETQEVTPKPVEKELLFKAINIEKEHPDVWESAKLAVDLEAFTELIKTIVFEKSDKFESPWMVAANLVEQHINSYTPCKTWKREQATRWFKTLIQKTTARRKEEAAKAKSIEVIAEPIVMGPTELEVPVIDSVVEIESAKTAELIEAQAETVVTPAAEETKKTQTIDPSIVEKYTELTKEPVINEIKRWVEKFLLDPITGSSIIERGKSLIPVLHMHKKWKKAPPHEILNFINATIRNSKNVEFKDIKLSLA